MLLSYFKTRKVRRGKTQCVRKDRRKSREILGALKEKGGDVETAKSLWASRGDSFRQERGR